MNANDRILSIRHHIKTLFPNTFLETEGRVRNMARPIWSIRRINHREQFITHDGYADIDQWSIQYYAPNRKDADTTLQIMQDSIISGGSRKNWIGRIQGWRFDWQYPQPVVVAVTGGNLIQGTSYEIRISGIDLCDNESIASVPLVVPVLAPNNALKIRALRQPFQSPLFKSINVYVNGHFQINIPQLWPQLYPTVILGQVVGSGALPKEVSTPIRWKFIRVDTWNASIREDDIQDGLFNGRVTLETTTYQERDVLQPDPINNIVGTQQVVPTPSSTPVSNPYVVPVTNTVKIGY